MKKKDFVDKKYDEIKIIKEISHGMMVSVYLGKLNFWKI